MLTHKQDKTTSLSLHRVPQPSNPNLCPILFSPSAPPSPQPPRRRRFGPLQDAAELDSPPHHPHSTAASKNTLHCPWCTQPTKLVSLPPSPSTQNIRKPPPTPPPVSAPSPVTFASPLRDGSVTSSRNSRLSVSALSPSSYSSSCFLLVQDHIAMVSHIHCKYTGRGLSG
ncbi:hypothetical protein PIB30_110417 [Stylosanthes scabra]|uniref:Uncharacterized protein n=1 Tax=Stylosanthes scabra TaxID=79078 RepID=A0ABU6QZI9_9FABA|nr:hypothetical protein [Stylosanthes scabra]